MEYIASEDDFLKIIDGFFPAPDLCKAHMLSPRGHDCVELACPDKMVLTSDLFLEDVHFRTSYFSFEEVGYKALAVNLSDIAACGALPLGFNMNIIFPPQTKRGNAVKLVKGMAGLAKAHKLPLTGGDISKGSTLGICITIWGQKGGAPFLQRARAKNGDVIFIFAGSENSGKLPLGLARTGLMALEEWGRERSLASFPKACAAHLHPVPLVNIGHSLAAAANKHNARVGLMDLSDGLARDIPRLLGWSMGVKTLGARVEIPSGILNEELHAFCDARGIDPVHHAFKGGEDYLLIGTSSSLDPLEETAKETKGHFAILGRVTDSTPGQCEKGEKGEKGESRGSPAIFLNNEIWDAERGTGFDHFAG